MKVKFKKLHPDAKIPQYAKPGDAGLDLYCVSMKPEIRITNHRKECVYLEFYTGLAIEVPEGYVGLLFPRSSISNTSMTLSNSVGILDSSFRGEVTFRFRNINNNLNAYQVGDKIGQLLVIPFPKIEMEETEYLSETERGSGGYGSSGR